MKTADYETKLIMLLAEAIGIIQNIGLQDDADYLSEELDSIIQTITISNLKNS